jgi:phytoene dehydrogenase-like protein
VSRDAVIVGSGPNGLAAAVELARSGLSVTVVEAGDTVGGGTRSAELTLPGFVHDVCSAIHPLGVGSPYLASLPLERYGLSWIQPPSSLAHPFEEGPAVLLERSPVYLSGVPDADLESWRTLMAPFAERWGDLSTDILAPPHFPAHPLLLLRFGLRGIRSAASLARSRFEGKAAQALFAGLAAHSFLAMEEPVSAAFGVVLGVLGHAVGWPVAAGGSGSVAVALAEYLKELGGEIVTGVRVDSLRDLPPVRSVILDVTPREALRICGDRFRPRYRRRSELYRYGPGVCKVDWALSAPIPWRDPGCLRAATVHVGGTLEEIAAGEREVRAGKHPERPFVLVAQQSLFDPSRAPAGKHTGWAYCHVPNGSDIDMTERIERQIERFAPGFSDVILARSTRTAAGYEVYNRSFIGGDINGGLQDWRQLLSRPLLSLDPYHAGDGIFLCSAATPPGGGVHGMGGYHAARSVLRRIGKDKSRL